MARWTIRDIPDQTGKLAIVTGATGGLGLETAIALAGAGAEVILAGRNPAKGRTAVAAIADRHSNARVRFEKLDLASLVSVAEFAEKMLVINRNIDILVNNAGVMAPTRRNTTADGFEMQLGTNYLSHFSLTARLLPLLAAAKARVVQISSNMHRGGTIRFDDLNYVQGYKPWATYSQSKLAMLMFALELDRRSDEKGWGLTSVAAHPGVAATDLTTNGPNVGANPIVGWVTRMAARMLGHSAADGALPQLMAATLPGVKGGQYFGPQGWKEYKGPPGLGKIAPCALDKDVAAKLWAVSEKLTGISFV